MLAERLWIDAEGRVAVPQRPGLGFALDWDAVAYHTVAGGAAGPGEPGQTS
jgi:L-alanine-DL-glutamate epimerase-like enolase superfamily enzyme